MKPKHFYIVFLSALLLVSFSCKKKDTTVTTPPPTASLNAAYTGGTLVYAQMQTFMTSTIPIAADSGHVFYFPSGDSASLKPIVPPLKPIITTDYPWLGPDANGYYYRSFSSTGYLYYERIHLGDTIDYYLKVSYSGGDGSFENDVTTKYIKKTNNGKVTYDGYSIWDVSNSGYNLISRWTWRINFTGWNPLTAAGTYDWFWGLSQNSGGNTVPYHRFEHLVATETTPSGWLHCVVIIYDEGGTQLWQFAYDTPWSPVEMPQIPAAK